MKITYDKLIDYAYIYLKDIGDGEAVKTINEKIGDIELIFDFDKDGRLLGIEVPSASKRLSEETLSHAENI